jgi:hypothetical protein
MLTPAELLAATRHLLVLDGTLSQVVVAQVNQHVTALQQPLPVAQVALPAVVCGT